jgi:hypothetical protein
MGKLVGREWVLGLCQGEGCGEEVPGTLLQMPSFLHPGLVSEYRFSTAFKWKCPFLWIIGLTH